MIYRYGKQNNEAKKRIRHELEIIDKLGFLCIFSDNMGYCTDIQWQEVFIMSAVEAVQIPLLLIA